MVRFGVVALLIACGFGMPGAPGGERKEVKTLREGPVPEGEMVASETAVEAVRKVLPFGSHLDVRWAVDLKDRKVKRIHVPPASLEYAYILVETDQHDLIAFHRRSGNALWWTKLEAPIFESIAFTEHAMYFLVKSYLVSLERYSGEAIWRNYLEVPFAYGPEVVEVVERKPIVFLPSLDRRIYAYEVEKEVWPPEKGVEGITRKDFVMERHVLRLLWRTAVFGLISGPIRYNDRQLFIADDSKTLYGVDTTKIYAGRPESVWAFHARGALEGAPLLLGPHVFSSSRDSYVYCLSQRDGGRVWATQTGHTLKSGPFAVLDPHTNRTFILQSLEPDGPLLALEDTTGKEVWKEPLPAVSECVARFEEPDYEINERTLLVLRNADGSLSAHILSTGERLWGLKSEALGPFTRNLFYPFVFTAAVEGRWVCALEKRR